MRILITGSSGFFGKEILRVFDSHSIFTLNRNSGNYQYDLCQTIPEFSIAFDIVIHNAGKAHSYPKTEREKHSFFDTNIHGTKNLLRGLEKKIPKQFVFISSVSVYGLESGINIDENTPLNAKDSYGLSKVLAEQMVIDWCKCNNVVCTILRLPLIVGVNPPGNLGAMLKSIKKGYYFNIAGGKAKKSMVLAEDVARFIPMIARVGGIYNLTDGVHPSISDLSKVIAQKKVKNLPLFLAVILGYLGDCLGENAVISSFKIRKITSDLTFHDGKARDKGWRSQSVLEYLKVNEL
jgi:nucleoside-diphosphate-sugar epimerase